MNWEGIAMNETNESTPKSYFIPVRLMRKFEVDMARIGRKAKRLGFAPPSYTLLGQVERKAKKKVYQSGFPVEITQSVMCEEVTIENSDFCISGYTFIATLEHISDEGPVIHCAPGQRVPACYRSAINSCDHCNLQRNRIETFVLRHDESQTHKQIGRNCLKDFLGHSAESIACAFEASMNAHQLASAYSDLEEFESSGGFRPYHLLLPYLQRVAQITMTHGFVSLKKARQSDMKSTVSRMMGALANCGEGVEVSEEAAELAEKTIEWAESLPEPEEDLDDSNYLHNIRKIALSRIVTDKQHGIVCSMVSSYQRTLEKKEPKVKSNSQYVGNVGDRSVFHLTVDKVVAVPGFSTYNYESTNFLHIMSDECGNVFFWKSTSGKLEVGSSYVLRGTIKNHSEYSGVKQTVLTSCKEVCFRQWILTVAGTEHLIEAESEKEAKDALKVKLGIARMPKGLVVRAKE